jgi:hypothetical protein
MSSDSLDGNQKLIFPFLNSVPVAGGGGLQINFPIQPTTLEKSACAISKQHNTAKANKLRCSSIRCGFCLQRNYCANSAGMLMNHSGGASKRRCENSRDNIIIGEKN